MVTAEGRFSLISGLRRLMALEALGAPHALAFIRKPESAAEAYVAMVEENEIRANLSFYERAAIAWEATDAGVFPDAGQAVAELFGSAPAAKRWKIHKFGTIHALLGDVLKFPEALPEKFGLALVERLESDHAFFRRLKDRLRKTPAREALPVSRQMPATLPGAFSNGADGGSRRRKPSPWPCRRTG